MHARHFNYVVLWVCVCVSPFLPTLSDANRARQFSETKRRPPNRELGKGLQKQDAIEKNLEDIYGEREFPEDSFLRQNSWRKKREFFFFPCPLIWRDKKSPLRMLTTFSSLSICAEYSPPLFSASPFSLSSAWNKMSSFCSSGMKEREEKMWHATSRRVMPRKIDGENFG